MADYDFSTCTSVEALDVRYKEFFAQNRDLVMSDKVALESLQDAHRKAHERFVEAAAVISPVLKIVDGDGFEVDPAPGVEVRVAEVRIWAAANGITVGKRGRLHPDVIKAWQNREVN